MKTYGLTEAEVVALERVTNCPRCGNAAEDDAHSGPASARLHVDHDHVTGKVRGPLCHRCNGILGWARDDAQLLRNLAEYLEDH